MNLSFKVILLNKTSNTHMVKCFWAYERGVLPSTIYDNSFMFYYEYLMNTHYKNTYIKHSLTIIRITH